jgi:hypothetical protein
VAKEFVECLEIFNCHHSKSRSLQKKRKTPHFQDVREREREKKLD